jgi:hypothetical protein
MIDVCAYEECGEKFDKQTHNQRYCSDTCRRIATNLKIREKYYEHKDRLHGKKRICSQRGCNNQLSRYNANDICQTCIAKKETLNRNSILGIIRNVSG